MQQQGGTPYGVTPSDMVPPPFSSPEAGPRQPRMIGIPSAADYLQQQQPLAEAASPISSRPGPPLHPAASRPTASIFDQFGSAVGSVGGSFADEEALGAGEEGERGVGGGNRWPRQETLALLKIRSEMDAAFRDATLKGPIWEDVSRKLAELGYARSAKKCKEKFENVHKYYKRTKEGRAGRQDGKSYRFFSQLEALHSSNTAAATAPTSTSIAALGGGSLTAPHLSTRNQSIAAPILTSPPPAAAPAPLSRSASDLAPAAGISFSSSTSSSSASESDGEETEEGGAGGLQDGSRKRKREGWHGGSRKMMAFFEGLMKQVMERQELMQQRFLESIEKREQDRMIREEAWKRQEMVRLNREYELMAQERTMTASRDAAVISFLQKFSGSSEPNHPPAAAISSPAPPPQTSPAPAAPPHPSPQKHAAPVVPGEVPAQPQPQPHPQPQPPPQTQPHPQPQPPPQTQPHPQPQPQYEANDNHESNEVIVNHPPVLSEPSSAVVLISELPAETAMVGGSLDIVSPSSSRWPKPEVLALIKLRSGLDTKYHESGPKGPLWEEISLGMKRLSYSRSAKRCKEKWENINKYFKKVKESNKKRPEDAKTCPYFHELDALYRKKQIGGASVAAAAGIPVQQQQEITTKTDNPQQVGDSLITPSQISGLKEHENYNGTKNQTTIPRSNGGIPQVFFGETPNRGGGAAMKKPEDIVKELMEQHNQPRRVVDDYDKFGGEPVDSDTANHEYDDDEDDDDDDEDDGNLRYEIQFQRPGVRAASGGARSGSATGKVATAPASTPGSFLGMVQ